MLCFNYFQASHMKQQEVSYDGNFTLAVAQAQNIIHEHPHYVPVPEANWRRVLKTILGFSGVWSTCAIAGIVALTSSLPWFQALCLPACLCLLSLSWCPRVQVYIVRSSDGTFQGRWKATCLYTVFKIITLLMGLSIVMVIRMKQHSVMDKNFFFKLWDGLNGCKQHQVLYPLLLHFGSSFFAHVLSYCSSTLCIPLVGMTLPAIFATPISIGLGMFFCSPAFVWLDELMCFGDGAGVWCAFVLAAITWMAPIIIKGKTLNPSSGILLKPFDELFIQPTWNSIFLDQHMFLNYKQDGFSDDSHVTSAEKNQPSRIFICTTMYREADFEMGRLLRSLHKISQSKRLKNVYLETHIFLDNGTKDLHLTDFASQLVSLLESKMEVCATKANALSTPYGVQLNWVLEGGMPFFIHLKDSGKVKSKKRWSQVMYMSYVLNFRVLKDLSRNHVSPEDDRSHYMDDSMCVGYASDREWERNIKTLSQRKGDVSGHQHHVTSSTCCSPSTCFKDKKAAAADESRPESELGDVDDIMRGSGTTKTINSLIESLGADLVQSSDQGIGHSDELSTSSLSLAKEGDTTESSGESRKNSLRNLEGKRSAKDEGWQDYEGDISSCNENSLTSLKAQQITGRAREFLHRDIGNIIYEHSSNSDVHAATRYPTSALPQPPALPPDRPPRPKRAPPHPRDQRHHKHHRPKRELKHSSSRAHLLQSSDSAVDLNQAYTNPAFSGSVPGALNEKDDIFTICRKTIPTCTTPEKRQIPLDDQTYILATDADMEFTDEAVADLLNLCNHDHRLGGACGRTHPIGQRTGPLLWYQQFEYAKGKLFL